MSRFPSRPSRFAIVLLAAKILLLPLPVLAQEVVQPGTFEIKARAADAATLVSGQTSITLWGIERVPDAAANFRLKARTALDNAINNNPLRCQVRRKEAGAIFAQCVNGNDLDLSLFMVQQGYATVDRAVVYGTVFEEAYLQGEMQAQDRGLGIWADRQDGKAGTVSSEGGMMVSLAFVLFLCVIASFAFLSLMILRGFKRVIEAQNDNMQMMVRERKLRDKEREIVAIMFDAEMKVNKSKIEAYLVVYEEVLSSLKDPNRAPKYKRAGDIIQRQPALDRSVFDRNTDKMDILGRDLSSELIHFYARVKTRPDYVNLEPETDLQEAIQMVEESVQSAKKLDQLAQKLIDAFRVRDMPAAGPPQTLRARSAA